MSRFAEYDQFDGLGLADLIRRHEVTPDEVLEAAIARIELHNPAVNAVIHPMFDDARARLSEAVPRSPFGGVPYLLKDLVANHAGVPTRSGSRFLRDFVPDHDTTLVARTRATGLVTLGKTNTPEFGLTPVTEPELFGPTRNPWNLERTAGGSSGGSAAAVALRMVPIAGGGDGGGSIRIPASCCGIFGMKPTRGRTPVGPDRSSIWQGSVVEHALTWSVRDSAALLDATAGPEGGAGVTLSGPVRPYASEVTRDPGTLRIAMTATPFLGHDVDPACLRALEETADLLRRLGHDVVETAPAIEGREFARAFLTMVAAEFRADLREAEAALGRTAHRGDMELASWTLARLGGSIPATRYAAALRDLDRTTRLVNQFFTEWDVLLTPTLASPPVPHGALRPPAGEQRVMRWLGSVPGGGWVLNRIGALEQSAESVFDFLPWTPVFNVTGQPAMSVPLAWSSEGLPIGMHFVGRWGDESTLFRLAGQLEREVPWGLRRPPEPRGTFRPLAATEHVSGS